MNPEDQVELEHRLTVLEQQMQDIHELRSDVRTILDKFSKYETRWGIFAMIGAALWAVFVTFKDNLIAFWAGK